MKRLRRQLFVRSLEDRTVPATFTVMNLADSGADSLRDCISKANAAAGADTIDFKAGLTGAITLTSGEIAISGALTALGPGAANLTLNGNNASRIFNTQSAATGSAISLSALTFTNATANLFGGAILAADESLTFDGCVFSANKSVTKSGGAIGMLGAGTLTARDCTFTNNVASTFAGAIVVAGFANTTLLQRCTISGNTAGSGGALYVYDNLIMESCTLSGNSATTGRGGAIYCNASGSITQCTISGNSAATDGGAVSLFIHVAAENLTIHNSTITNNSANTGKGGGIARISTIGGIALESSIVSGNTNTAAPDISSTGTVTVKTSAVGSGTGFTKTDQGGNLPFQAHANLKLGPLANNGGAMLTHMLLGGSPCLETGSNPDSLTLDQRGVGFPRVIGAAADMGAVEIELPRVSAFEPSSLILPPGATQFEIKVTYAATGGIKVSTIDFSDVTVTGPAFPTGTSPNFVARPGSDVTPATARYGISAPAGGFTTAHNGTYTVTVKAGQVQSVSGLFVPPGVAGTFTLTIQLRLNVDATNDESTDTDGKTSLREAIENANAHPGDDTVTFSNADFSAPQTIMLQSALGSVSASGNGSLTIAAPPARVTLDAGNVLRHINFVNNPLSLSNLSFVNGIGAIGNVFANLTLNNVLFLNNSGSSAITGSSTTSLNITDCTFDKNTSTGNGGAISWPNGTINIKSSTISNNSAAQGGGIFIQGAATLLIENSTVSGNVATQTSTGRGGGLAVIFTSTTPTITIRNSTITNNTAQGLSGGGIHISPTSTNNIVIESTIVADNLHPGSSLAGAIFSPDFFGPNSTDTADAWDVRVRNSLIGILEPPMDFTVSTANFIGSKAAPQNANLGPLADNGGPTQTHALLAGSPAINNGNNKAGLAFDQRGFPRVQSGVADIGAFESLSPIPFASATASNVLLAGGTVHTITVQYADDVGIDTASLDNSDITVNGPGGPIPATFTGFTGSAGAVTAKYDIVPPGGSWDIGDNGTYSIAMIANQVFDTDAIPNSIPAGKIGTFIVALGGTFVVTATNDETTDTDGKLSLREALDLANLNSPTTNTITFDPVVFATPQTIILTVATELSITDSVIIIGPAAKVTVDANFKSRHFNIDGTGTLAVSISAMTLTNGTSGTGDGGSIRIADEVVILSKMTLSGNKAEGTAGDGGAITITAATSDVTMLDCTISGNSATSAGGEGGGVNVDTNGKLTMLRCSVTGNTAGRNGGGVYFFAGGTLVMDDSTVSGNTANKLTAGSGGGGIYLFSTTATIRNSTISGNSASNGGGIGVFAAGTTLIQNSTIAFNTAATAGGGITRPATAAITIESTIVSDNTAPTGPDINGTIGTMNASLVGNSADLTITTGAGNLLDVAAKLGSLADNGGPTLTYALLSDSPAIDKGSNPSSLTTDQRGPGFARDFNGVDMGAFELQPLPSPPTVISIVINDGAVQRSLITSIKVSFSEAVNFPSGLAAAFVLERTAFGSPGAVGLTFSPSNGPTSDVSITFNGTGVVGIDPGGSLADGKYLLTIVADKITGVGGTLDGDGDLTAEGSPTDNKTTSFHRLFGDSDGNATVNSTDFAVFRTFFGLGASIFDFTADGLTNSNDFAEFRKRFGISIGP